MPRMTWSSTDRRIDAVKYRAIENKVSASEIVDRAVDLYLMLLASGKGLDHPTVDDLLSAIPVTGQWGRVLDECLAAEFDREVRR